MTTSCPSSGPPARNGADAVVLGRLIDFSGDPAARGRAAVRDSPGGALALRHGRISWTGAAADLPADFESAPRFDYGQCLVLPGFVDPHIHFPQYRIAAAGGRGLLDWLDRFAFPEEARYADGNHAAAAAETFLDLLLAHGTTAALVFSTVHEEAADRLFAAAGRRGMALAAGKTLMDRGAPAALRDDAEGGLRASERLHARWHGRGRLRYAVSPRFAITSGAAQLAAAGEFLESHPDALMQTHLSETPEEIAEVARLFPDAADYTDVYDRFGLLGPRSLFAHGVHLSARERERLGEAGAAVVHCPTSNAFLGSGLFDIGPYSPEAGRAAPRLAVATDIGGGTSYSLPATLGAAYRTAQLRGRRLAPERAFYLATLGNAEALGMEHEIGRLEPGCFADLVVLDPCATPLLAARDALSETLADTLLALMILGDDRIVRASWVAGRQLHPKPDDGPAG